MLKNNIKKTIIILVGLVFLISLGMGLRHFGIGTLENNAENTNASIGTASLFATSLMDAQGQQQSLSQYQGKIIVLNFWATWCPPCREEMPELSQLYLDYQNKNVVVLGVAIDELKLVQEYLQSSPVSYPILIAENERMDLSNQLGNAQDVLPYTVIIDANGKIAKTYYGRINKSLLTTAIEPLLTH